MRFDGIRVGVVLFLLVFLIGCVKEEKVNEKVNETNRIAEDVDLIKEVYISKDDELQEEKEDIIEEESYVLAEEYLGLWELDKIVDILNLEYDAEAMYMEVDQNTVSFYYEESFFYQVFKYKVLEKSNNKLEIIEFSDPSGVAKEMGQPYRLILDRTDDEMVINVEGMGDSQIGASRLISHLVDESSLDKTTYIKVLSKVEEDEYLFNSWIWDITELKGLNLRYMIEPIVYKYNFKADKVQVDMYETIKKQSSSYSNQCKVFQSNEDYYIFFEDNIEYKFVEKINEQTALFHSYQLFPTLNLTSDVETLRNDITIEDEMQTILKLNGSQKFSEQEIDFFNKHIKGNWKDSASENELEVSLYLYIYAITTGLNENYTETLEPSFYSILDINLELNTATIKYTNENKASEFRSEGVPEDIIMTLEYIMEQETLVIKNIESSSKNQYIESVLGTKFWRVEPTE